MVHTPHAGCAGDFTAILPIILWLLQVYKTLTAQQQLNVDSVHNPAAFRQLQEAAGLTQSEFRNALRAVKLQQVSLDSPVQRSTASGKALVEQQLADSIPAEEAVGMSDDACFAAIEVQRALLQLPKLEAAFIRLKYGLQDGSPKSCAQVLHQRLLQTDISSVHANATCLNRSIARRLPHLIIRSLSASVAHLVF